MDGIEVLEQKDVLDYDTDGNTTEITRSYYHRNALGSVMEITDANQAAAVSYRYDPYGKVTITVGGTPQSSDPLGQHWTYAGRFHDEECDLYYYRNRSYSSTLGRFLQRDPIGLIDSPVLYEYARNSPANYIDPLGTTVVN
ncbi:MAG: RHS repeat-associated core domain-containing protein, partial [Gemmatimonadota bacterium]